MPIARTGASASQVSLLRTQLGPNTTNADHCSRTSELLALGRGYRRTIDMFNGPGELVDEHDRVLDIYEDGPVDPEDFTAA